MDKQTAIKVIEKAIEVLGPIPANEWITGHFTNHHGVCCVIGHFTRLTSDAPTNYSIENCRDIGIDDTRDLRKAYHYLHSSSIYSGFDIADINNGDNSEYQQDTPKERVMQALQDILEKAKQENV